MTGKNELVNLKLPADPVGNSGATRMKSPQPTCLRAISGSSFGGGPARLHVPRSVAKDATGNQPMTAKAYVLIGTQGGKKGEVVDAIRKLQGVASVDAVTGPYDTIAVIVGETLNDIGEIIVSKVQAVAGVSRTVTCLASLPEGRQV